MTPYERLKRCDELNRQNKLMSRIFSADGPQGLLPALPHMVTLLDALQACDQFQLPPVVKAAMAPLFQEG